MLKITNEGRKIALDQRLINELLPDYENSKIDTCSQNIYRIWEETKDKKSAQLVFCDLSTPKGDGSFGAYTDLKNKLVEKVYQKMKWSLFIMLIQNYKNKHYLQK